MPKVVKKARTVMAKARTAKERMARERMAKKNGTGKIFLPKVVDQIADPQMELLDQHVRACHYILIVPIHSHR